MKILIVGASSFIGFRLFNFIQNNTQYDVVGTCFKNKKDDSFIFLDITDKFQLTKTFIEQKPDVIVWVAGSKNLKECEASIDFAKKINSTPIEQSIDILRLNNICAHFVFFSTDYIFDGEKGNFKDYDIPNPKTNYGRSKYYAEQFLLESNINYSIVRTSAVMGAGGTFFDWVVKELKNKKHIELFDDSFFTPTPINMLIEAIIILVKNKEFGTYNICGGSRLTRFEFVSLLKSLDKNFIANLIPVPTPKNMLHMQHDLSMDLSVLFGRFKATNIEEYLKKELVFDQVYKRIL